MKKCIICEAEIDENKVICYNCWTEAKKEYERYYYAYEDQVKDHYFKLKTGIVTIKKESYVKKCKKNMVALAVGLYWDFNENYLIERLKKDLEEIETKRRNVKITQKKEQNNELKNEIDDYRKTYPAEQRCEDGHYVRSKSEQIIDNWLYNHNYMHAYEQIVFGDDKEYIPDFYLKNEDCYIEYWGKEEETYLLKKDEKLAFYKKQGIKIISLDDKDIQHINDVLPRMIRKIQEKK